jgi:hypothetical protein
MFSMRPRSRLAVSGLFAQIGSRILSASPESTAWTGRTPVMKLQSASMVLAYCSACFSLLHFGLCDSI